MKKTISLVFIFSLCLGLATIASGQLSAGWQSADVSDPNQPCSTSYSGRSSVFSIKGSVSDINRILYVDDIEVARDTATNLDAGGGGLFIGAGR